MKIDRFSDSIRRKLESIRPDFSEGDWARMQTSLRQSPSGAPIAHQPLLASRSRPWLMTAAAVGFVVLVSFAAWQRAQIITLHQTVSYLSQQTTRLRQPLPKTVANTITRPADQPVASLGKPLPNSPNQSASRNDAPDRRPDTVFITRYITLPQFTHPAPERTAQRPVETNGTGELVIDRDKLTGRTVPPTNALPRQPRANPSVTNEQRNDRTAGGAVVDKVTSEPTAMDVTGAGNETVPDNPTTDDVTQKALSQPTNQSEMDKTSHQNRPAPATNDRTGATGKKTTINTSGSGDAADMTVLPVKRTDADFLATRPLSIAAIDWNEALARRARRMRPARTTTVGGPAAPVSQPVDRVAFSFRIGTGGELSRAVQSGGLLTEVLIGKHLTLGVGVGMASFAGGSFTTDVEFDRKRPRKFRREYARNIDPRSDIVNIATRTVRLQIPVTVGYRIPISRTLSLLPAVGTTLGLRSRELVTFTYRQPLRNFESASGRIARPVNLFNNLTLGAGLEWKQTHWVLQAGPLLTIPTTADANWQETASLGLRARVFYQF